MRFLSRHAAKDEPGYLDTKEDADNNKEARAFRVIEEFCRANGIVHITEIYGRRELFQVLCRRLVADAGLTLRKVAECPSTSRQRVHEAVRD